VTRYTRSDGKLLTLSDHTVKEWADKMYRRFRDLGCSPTAARRMTRPIRKATPYEGRLK